MTIRASVMLAQAQEMPVELMVLLASGDARLSICELADRLGMPRKQALLLLVTLESQGMVGWDDAARLYRPNMPALAPLLSMVAPGKEHQKPAKKRLAQPPHLKVAR